MKGTSRLVATTGKGQDPGLATHLIYVDGKAATFFGTEPSRKEISDWAARKQGEPRFTANGQIQPLNYSFAKNTLQNCPKGHNWVIPP